MAKCKDGPTQLGCTSVVVAEFSKTGDGGLICSTCLVTLQQRGTLGKLLESNFWFVVRHLV